MNKANFLYLLIIILVALGVIIIAPKWLSIVIVVSIIIGVICLLIGKLIRNLLEKWINLE